MCAVIPNSSSLTTLIALCAFPQAFGARVCLRALGINVIIIGMCNIIICIIIIINSIMSIMFVMVFIIIIINIVIITRVCLRKPS